MATQPVREQPGRFVTVEEYLSTVYEPGCEYDNGVVVERNLGEFEHAYLQTLLAALFTNNMQTWGVFGLVEQQVQINPQRYLIPDICVLRIGARTDDILSEPPLIVFEILSPEDKIRQAAKKAAEYLQFGVEHVWIIDPHARVAYKGTPAGLQRVPTGELAVQGTPIAIRISELFEKLDAIRSRQQK